MTSSEILVCSDLSEVDTNLVLRARLLAKHLNAGITVIHAIDPMRFPMIDGAAELLVQIKPHIRERLHKIVDVDSGSVRLLLEEGHPATVIPDVIDRLGANLVVLGIRGNGYVDV